MDRENILAWRGGDSGLRVRVRDRASHAQGKVVGQGTVHLFDSAPALNEVPPGFK